MARSEEERWAVVVHWKKGLKPTAIVRELSQYNLTVLFVRDTIKRYLETGDIKDR